VVAALDEPLGDPAAVPTYVVSELASRSVKVVLTGEGGDEVFSGYDTYRREEALAPLLRVPVALRRLAASPLAGAEPWSLHAQRVRAILTAGAGGWHTAFSTRIHASERARLYGADLRARLAALAASHGGNGHGTSWRGRSAAGSARVEDLGTRLPDGLLMKVDKMTMAHGLEARTPLLDHGLVEWALALPSTQHQRADTGKLLLKRVAARLLPPDIVRRPKHPFDVPIGRWLRGPLGASFAEARAVLAERGFRRAELERIARRVARGEQRAEHPGWILFVLGRWLGTHPEVRVG
jgi:asparagine synthase (glutamine-hydrolysing)